MGKLMTVALLAGSAYYWYRQKYLVRVCPSCRAENRAKAQSCKACGVALEGEGPVIEVEAERV